MKILEVDKTQPFVNNHNIDARRIYDYNCAQIIHMTLHPGESLKSHSTPVDVAFYTLEGSGLVEIGGKTAQVNSGACIESPKNIPHRLINTTNKPFKFLVIKMPQ
ncbi:MAG TPA: cupin domain-containing protein [Candidatus Atribacteria bacterium]|nr:cupin domain-containing protein [Candidatus Atribacteria bacterium]